MSLVMHPFLKKTVSRDLLDELTSREAFDHPVEPGDEVADWVVLLADGMSSYMTEKACRSATGTRSEEERW
ncbi:hypothetical protein [Actinomadura rudentiformis]|uniref:Uncharacterized protein n=1 Tax=Actinomadura rudentiformis TaxID=359158 RepID=A0A6H9YLV9_9ACTN|nr:hypothetical protein [Actinomadura rudentiformis]KAB2344136.1 hypothetical protein F8566_33035 [Actinomadura rudentiformis]